MFVFVVRGVSRSDGARDCRCRKKDRGQTKTFFSRLWSYSKPAAISGRAPPPVTPPALSVRLFIVLYEAYLSYVALSSVALMVPVGFVVDPTRPDRAGLLVATKLVLDTRALSVFSRSLIPPMPPSCGVS